MFLFICFMLVVSMFYSLSWFSLSSSLASTDRHNAFSYCFVLCLSFINRLVSYSLRKYWSPTLQSGNLCCFVLVLFYSALPLPPSATLGVLVVFNTTM